MRPESVRPLLGETLGRCPVCQAGPRTVAADGVLGGLPTGPEPATAGGPAG